MIQSFELKNLFGLIFTLSSGASIIFTDGKIMTACFESNRPLEVILACDRNHAILISSIIHGRRNNTECVAPAQDNCGVKAMDRHMVLSHCMAQQSCVAPVEDIWLPQCQTYSNYVAVTYTCIPVDLSSLTIVDSCGDRMNQEFTRQEGYIESLGYPNVYPYGLHCQCNLTTGDKGEIVLDIIDMKLPPAPPGGSCVNADWVEYALPEEGWNRGTKLCNSRPGQNINIRTTSLSINFYTDNDDETRGFWIKYSGRTSDGKPRNVTVQCGIYSGPLYTNSPVTNQPGEAGNINEVRDTNGTPQYTSQIGFIIGICVAVLLIFVIIAAIVAYNIKRKKEKEKKKLEEQQMQSSELNYGSSTKLYRTMPYNSLDTMTIHSGRSREISLPSGGHGDYYNPAYEGYLPPADYPTQYSQDENNFQTSPV